MSAPYSYQACRFCGHSLTMHVHGAHCQVLDCRCVGLAATSEQIPATPADAREKYLAGVASWWRSPERSATIEDVARAAWDAGYLHAQRGAG